MRSIITRYRAFGWALGIAFQLNDDLLGIWGEQAATGKEPTDVARHKMTLPVIYAFEHASRMSARAWSRSGGRTPRTDGQVAEAVALIEKLGGRDYTRDQAREHRDRALAELEAAGVVDAEALESLRAIIVGRDQGLADPRPGRSRRPTALRLHRPGRGSSPSLGDRAARTLPTRWPSVDSTVRRSPWAVSSILSPGCGTPPMRW